MLLKIFFDRISRLIGVHGKDHQSLSGEFATDTIQRRLVTPTGGAPRRPKFQQRDSTLKRIVGEGLAPERARRESRRHLTGAYNTEWRKKYQKKKSERPSPSHLIPHVFCLQSGI